MGSAAARLRRLDDNAGITVFEKSAHVAFASSALPYCIGGTVGAGDIIAMQTKRETIAQYGIDVRLKCEVTAVNRHG